MKIKSIACLLGVFLIVSSCEDRLEENIIESNNLDQINSIVLTSRNGFERTFTFKECLSITASAIALTLIEYPDTRQEIFDLNSQSSLIPLSKIFINSGQRGNQFNSRINFILNEFLESTNPEPEHGILIPPPPGEDFSSEEDYLVHFIRYILEENCVELYLPNGLIFTGISGSKITAVGHPLDNSTLVYGVKYSASSRDLITIDQNYLDPNSTIVLVRPVRNQTCQYNQYSSVPDFRRFLNTN